MKPEQGKGTSGQLGPKSKRRGLIRTLTEAAGAEVSAQVERENIGAEAAHKTGQAARAAVRFAGRQHRRRPERQERTHTKSSADNRRTAQKHEATKRQLQKQRQAKQAKKAAKTAKDTAKNTRRAIWAVTNSGKTAKVAAANPHVALIVFIIVLRLVLQFTLLVVLLFVLGSFSAVMGTSYLAADEDIDEAELRYTEWETDLTLEALNAEDTYPGYDEYRYDLASTGHDPYSLMAYLHARYFEFTFAEVEGELWDVFCQQYSLTFTETVEVRYRVEIRWEYIFDEWGGYWTSYEVEVPYDYYILTVTLTALPFEDVILPRLADEDEQTRYDVHMFLRGNRQIVGSPFPFYWVPRVTSGYGYRVHPVTGQKDYHMGVDIGVPEGTPIQAGGNGVVLEAGDRGTYGLTVLVDYGDGITARYAHCSSLLVRAGQTISMGEVIALSGNTGQSTGPHLHYEVHKNGRPLNPMYFSEGNINY